MNFVQPIRNKEDIEAIKGYFTHRGMHREKLLFTIGINSSLRIGDILRLTWGDVSSGGSIKDSIKLKEQKTGKTKVIRINNSLREALERHLEGFYTRGGGYLFPSLSFTSKGKAWTRQYAWKMLKDAGKAVGIEQNIGTHTMRKTFGYFRREAGVPLHKLMRVFNHSSEAITLLYLGYTQEENDEVYELINL